jgi:hypothetical protein
MMRIKPNPIVKDMLMILALISGFNTILNPMKNKIRLIIKSNSPRNPNPRI